MAKAFEGVRVIDFTQVLAGPFCTAQLAALGADVVKIEQPKGGDQSRSLLADNEVGRRGMSPMFISVNAGKRSLTLDLKHPRAREVVMRLVAGADVVVENFKAGNMDRLGLGWEALSAVNPRLIYTSVSGYGQEGPYAGTAAYDGAIQASAGLMSVTGHPATGPTRTGFTAVDLSTAITAAFATAAALFRRQVTGEGQRVDVSMFDTSLTLMAPIVSSYLNAGETMPLIGNTSLTMLPTADIFPVKDGLILMSCLTQSQWAGLCRAIERPDLVADPRFATNADRRQHADAVRGVLIEAFAAAGPDEWEARLGAAGVPAAAVNDVTRAVKHPQLAHRDVIVEMAPPAGLDRPVTTINAGFTTTPDAPRPGRPPPQLGQHTDEILSEVGYAPAEIAVLRAEGVV